MTILLVDLSSIFMQNWHATKDLEIGRAHDQTLSRIDKYARDYEHTGVCLDKPPYDRKKLHSGYKSQRDQPSDAMIGQLQRVKDRLKADGFPLFEAEGAEADDVIATLVSNLPDEAIDILTGDKDLAQLVETRYNCISTQTGDRIDVNAVVKKFGVMPGQMHDFLALWGDKSDNIPGVPGVGPVKAAQIIKEFGSVPKLLEAIKAGSDRLQDLPLSVSRSLLDSVDQLEMSYLLVGLDRCLQLDTERLFAERVPQTIVNTEEGMSDLVEPIEGKIVKVPQQDVTIIKNNDWNKQLEPTGVIEAWKLCCTLCDSRLFPKFSTPEAIMAVMLRGRSLGLDVTTALNGFRVGKSGDLEPVAHIVIGMVMRSEKCEYFRCTETTSKQATYVTKRVGDPETSYTYTWQMAVDAELTALTKNGQKTNWHKRTDAMLRKTAGVVLSRFVYPDVIGGLYSHEEMEFVS